MAQVLAGSRNVLLASWRPLLTGAVLIGIAEAAKQANLLPVFVPAPSQVVMEAWKVPRLVTENLAPTAWKAAIGYSIAAVIAMTAGSIAVSLRALYGPIYNFGVVIHSIPIIATAPLLALWLGTGPQVQIAIAALASQFPMLVGTMQGLQAADARQRELMHVLSASRFQTLRYLLIPSALAVSVRRSQDRRAISGAWRDHRRMGGSRSRHRRDDALRAILLRHPEGLAVRLSDLLSCGSGLWRLGADRAVRGFVEPRCRACRLTPNDGPCHEHPPEALAADSCLARPSSLRPGL